MPQQCCRINSASTRLHGVAQVHQRIRSSMQNRPFLLVLSFLATSSAATLHADEPTAIAPDQFDKLHKMIRVQPDEQRFWQIPWKLTITDARLQAAAEGKPIFVWAGAGGAPIGVC
jgi:hypothetical protein